MLKFRTPLTSNYYRFRHDISEKPGKLTVLPGWIFVKTCAMLATVRKCFCATPGCRRRVGEFILNVQGVIKLNAMKILSAHFGISLADIIAFVDDYNDVSMLKNCGIGVDVENAGAVAKAVADFICDTNDNDGVAKWLKRGLMVTNPQERMISCKQ
jgi:hypothetical protein